MECNMNAKTILFLGLSTLLFHCKNKGHKKVYIPKQANEYVRIYKPSGDYFFGPDTKYLKEGEWYDDWVPNDHTFVKDDKGIWHIIGITHPLVNSDPLSTGIHDGEYASFHAMSTASSFKEALKEHHFKDLPKILPPSLAQGYRNCYRRVGASVHIFGARLS